MEIQLEVCEPPPINHQIQCSVHLITLVTNYEAIGTTLIIDEQETDQLEAFKELYILAKTYLKKNKRRISWPKLF